MPQLTDRRTFLKGSLATPAALALTTHGARAEESSKALLDEGQVSASDFPCGKIGDLKISRLLLGGNLLTHYAHSRGLVYVNHLAAHYNTPEKIIETMALAERHGVNTLVIHTVPEVMRTLREYREERGGKIQWIICPTAPIEDGLEKYESYVNKLLEIGTEAIYLWGVQTDRLVADGRVDLIEQTVDLIHSKGLPAGVGAHDLRVVEACEEKGIDVDFYIKTFHHHNYPNAPKPEDLTTPIREVPGYWCLDPEGTVEFMKKVDKPWIAFKVMAAGAIPPKEAFKYAFENGADHILAGMFDFEIAEDAQMVRDLFPNGERSRPWMS
ncbi:MAG: twin-arginine translocation signal domain-containing protein [Candidatus Omnitrophica bacterium]|nr:twin-arginine translocation signal domain-containing protein [Candidatus Omnitrophota bacterium]